MEQTQGMRVVYIAAGIICAAGAMLTALRLYGRRAGAKEAVWNSTRSALQGGRKII